MIEVNKSDDFNLDKDLYLGSTRLRFFGCIGVNKYGQKGAYLFNLNDKSE